jgi:hypothetical protein
MVKTDLVNREHALLDYPRPLVRGRDSLNIRVRRGVFSGRDLRESVGPFVEDDLIEGSDSAGDLN